MQRRSGTHGKGLRLKATLALLALALLGCGDESIGAGDATPDAPFDTSSLDAASDASADAPPEATDAGDASDDVDGCVLAPETPCPPCSTQDSGSGCCPTSGQCVAKQSQCNGALEWPCAARSDCPVGDDCCANLQGATFDTCPPTASSALQSGCGLQNSCLGGAICTSDGDCIYPKKCVGVQVTGLARTIGVCH